MKTDCVKNHLTKFVNKWKT